MSCRYPDPYSETVKLSPNRGDTIVPLYIILHHSGGSFAGGVSWILNPESKVSYHYLIDPETGNRVQLVWDSKGRGTQAGADGKDALGSTLTPSESPLRAILTRGRWQNTRSTLWLTNVCILWINLRFQRTGL